MEKCCEKFKLRCIMDHPMDNDVNEENEPVSKFTTLPERITTRLTNSSCRVK